MREKALTTPEAISALDDALAYYDAGDVQRWFERSKAMVGHYPRVGRRLIEEVRTFRKVPNEVFRQAWLPFDSETVPGLSSCYEEPAWVGLFRDEILARRAAPETLDSCTRKLGPGRLKHGDISGYLKRQLGIMPASGRESVTWLIDYELGEVLCKTMGLIPVQCGI